MQGRGKDGREGAEGEGVMVGRLVGRTVMRVG